MSKTKISKVEKKELWIWYDQFKIRVLNKFDLETAENTDFVNQCQKVTNSEYVEMLEQQNQELVEALKDAAKVLNKLGNERGSCRSYECCGNCGDIHEAEEAFDKANELLTKWGLV